MTLTPEQERQFHAQWDEAGETNIREDIRQGRFPPALLNLASRWLSEKERESNSRKDAFNSEQIEIARSLGSGRSAARLRCGRTSFHRHRASRYCRRATGSSRRAREYESYNCACNCDNLNGGDDYRHLDKPSGRSQMSKSAAKKRPVKPKLTDADRHKRFLEMARQVGASDDPKDFESALKKVTRQSPKKA